MPGRPLPFPRPLRRLLLPVLGAAGLLALPAGAQAPPRGGTPGAPVVVAALRLAQPTAAARAAGTTRRAVFGVPAGTWTVAADVHVPRGGTAVLRLGRRALVLRPRAGWQHVEASPARMAVDGVGRGTPGPGASVTLAAGRGTAEVRGLILGSTGDPESLLLQRLAALRARTPAGDFPLSTDPRGRLRFSAGWTSGFWPGALWQAAALTPSSPLFTRWALDATLAHLGRETTPTHDLGFMYGRSSAEGYDRLCPGRAAVAICARLRASGLRAADTLVRLAATNTAAGLIPMTPDGPTADTIIDSTMNLALLTWASRVSGDPTYDDLARRHAHRVAPLLVRGDGSTFQSVHVRRSDGRVLFTHTHQGLADDSVWARGQAWAVYGFARTGLELRDAALVRVAERAASYVAAHVPADGVPPYDDAAPPGAPRDVSAAAVTAAGLFRLDRACRALPGACADGARWVPLARRMLDGALAHVATRPALGELGDQVYALHARPAWQHRAELVLGIDYALEAVALRDGRATVS